MKVLSITLFFALAATPAQGIEANDAAADANVPQAASAEAPQDEEASSKQQQLRKLQATQKPCDRSLWRANRDAVTDWEDGYCSQGNIRNCHEVGYSTELACCKGQYAGQASGACLQRLPNPPTTSPTKEGGMDVWYPKYQDQWSEGTCTNDYPLPNGRPTYSSQLACCKDAYRGQASGACLMDLPSPPTTSPTSEGGMDIYYPKYDEGWAEGYCTNESPLPNGRPSYDTQLACCKGAYAGQTSGKCLMMLPNPPTTSPTTEVGELWYPDYESTWSEGTCKNDRPWPFTHGSRPTYDDQLTCCKGAYAGQTSGACLMALPNPPTTSPTAEEGPWYADRNQDFSVATCSNDYPTNRNEQTFETQEACCKGPYQSQTTDACMCAVDPCHSCKCFNFDYAKDKIKDLMNWSNTIGNGTPFTEYWFKLYCTGAGTIPYQGRGSNPDLTFDECCPGYDNDACMCKSEPCHSCECYDSAAAKTVLQGDGGQSWSGPDITNEYIFHDYCTGTAFASVASWLQNANQEQCYADPTKQPTPKPTSARRLGAAPAADQ